MKNFLAVFILAIVSCSHGNNDSKSGSKIESVNHFENVIHVEQFGDSMQLEVEKRGDTLIKHYMDLKGKTDDNFDDTYNVTCTYLGKANDTTLRSNFYLEENGYRFYLDAGKYLAYYDSLISKMRKGYNIESMIKYYEDKKGDVEYVKHLKQNEITLNPPGISEPEILIKLTSKIVEIRTNEKPKSLLIEFYETEYTGGKTLYIISTKNDTIKFFSRTDWIS
jgi:hypothetical protein